jgi:outer membrane protein OmpA-like peptidoglycan-associated protein
MRIFTVIILFLVSNAYGQLGFLEGTWQGIITTYNQSPKEGNAIWFEFKIDQDSGEMKGESRVETPFTQYFAYKNLKGKALSRNEISFEEIFIGLQKNTGRETWCLNKGTLNYDDSTGYLSGEWSSSDCRRLSGNIVLYRSKHLMSKSDTSTLYHSWFNNMVTDLKKGWNAYYVRDAEMRNFQFVPVYFDHDKDELKEKFEAYLKQMARIVNSHSDLRIKIIGHTDSNGTDDYNVDLSERRAERVRKFLMDANVPADKIVIEYRGERDPATSNATLQGKALNRRVDFEFI